MRERLKENLSVDRSASRTERYEQLRQMYMDGEISEAEYEQRVSNLLDDGDEFISEYEAKRNQSELRFRLREIGEVVSAFAIIGVFLFLVTVTKGAALLPLLGVFAIATLAYLRYSGYI